MSDTARWLRIKELFGQCQQQPIDRRDAWLAEQCGEDTDLLSEVQSLLAAQNATGGILGGDLGVALRHMGSAEAMRESIGKRIGNYRLLRLIGEGGMGSVFLAEREEKDFTQQVALKLIRADFVSDEARTRFLLERRILARLNHPHVAQFHDGGVTSDGAPYFTLEFVDGEPLTAYCDRHRLTIRERLRLIQQVCAAVSYAHRNLIVHRDLKPSNILVTADGEVKLLDFGIAKLLDVDGDAGKTATHAKLMTPEYAAPEQVLGEPVTTATDVYSIGVLLYELLSGRLPYARAEAGSISWSKAVIEEAPQPVYRALSRTTQRGTAATGETAAMERGVALSTLRRSLRGDLDRILQRALAKAPEARYASVGLLANDIGAYLDGRAIDGGTQTYRLRKFLRRYWLPLATTAVILLIVLSAAALIVRQARRTEHEAQTTLAVKDFLYGLFNAVDPRTAKGRTITANELLDRGAQRIGNDKTLDAAQRAEVEATLGRIYWRLGSWDQAHRLQDDALKAMSDGANPEALWRAQIEHADTLTDLGDLKGASVLADAANRAIDAMPNASIADRANALHVQARIALVQRDFPKTKKFSDAELAVVRSAKEIDTNLLFHALMTSGAASWGLKQGAAAEATWREALAVAQNENPPDELDIAAARINIGTAMELESKDAEAADFDLQALATEEKILGADHPQTMGVRRDLALAYYHLGRYQEAIALFEKVLAAQREKLGNDHPAIAGTEINLGNVLLENGDLAAAESVLSESVNIFEKKYGRDYEGARIALSSLGLAHAQLGKFDLAKSELEEVVAMERDAAHGVKQYNLSGNRLGELERLRGNFKAAIAIDTEELAESQTLNGENNRLTAHAHDYLALALRDGGDDEGATREFRAALNSYAHYLKNAEHPLAATTRFDLAQLLIKHDTTRAEGVSLLTEAAQLREKFFGADDPRTKQAKEALHRAQSIKA